MKKIRSSRTINTRSAPGLNHIQQAMRQAVREALLQHKQAGNPVAIWSAGWVVWVRTKGILVK